MESLQIRDQKNTKKTIQRTVHFIDIENLIGSGLLSAQSVQRTYFLYRQQVSVKPKDVFIVAAGPQNRRAVVEGWPFAYYKFKAGSDGADLALIDFCHDMDVLSTANKVVIGSGDNRFAQIAHLAKMSGLEVSIVTFKGAKSYKLHSFNSINLAEGN